ncbi:HlyD family type I secretion periplasmic adaptor subunit [Desulfoluna spongiiphila]|uniref:Membrane fusion protein, adhesin transport system n=1 Tax=Desulfoluna spongiiphila TaxID=419481 RepID=A0A1G5IYP8_9BACT|nr:HlyD family type I secretion periplasmic adaptor subunit [Desulfoluna spongiiphila]SCY81212.1 membrane fusion protein, adhesin transport system [Desulfoluna spongiiphila]VVS91821.1 rtx secretion protein d gram-negative bacteria [Desulfoluna spongiiphila]
MAEKESVQKRGAERPSRSLSATRYSSEDIEFMNSLSAAVLAGTPKKSNLFLVIIAVLVFSLIGWMSVARLDERTRGAGRVIPSRQIQVVQNLEGGIIKEIRVREGDAVTKGEVLISIDDTGVGSSYAESSSVINELRARSVRLAAEAGILSFDSGVAREKKIKALLIKEKRLYETNVRRKQSEIEVMRERLRQREIELAEAQMNTRMLESSTRMIAREMELTRPLYTKGLVSELEFIQLKQKSLDRNHELESARKKVETLNSRIVEAKEQNSELEERYRSEAQEEYNKVMAEIERLNQGRLAIEDRVQRTSVRSPVDGTVKQILINTVGGVVKPGMDILEIVPNEESLVVEAKIKPSDIAFLYPGLKAVVKITAYDFAIYGGLDGQVTHISADTITDDRKEEYYLVRIETDRNYLGTEENKKEIIVGMTAQVDIITGSKTVMAYLLKPILRAKENALGER